MLTHRDRALSLLCVAQFDSQAAPVRAGDHTQLWVPEALGWL